MSSFEIDLAKFGQKAVNNASRFVRKVAFDMHRGCAERCPVDTGRAKANMQLNVGRNPGNVTEQKDNTPKGQVGAANIAAAQSGIARFRLGDEITIYNNVEYIVSLEYGSSRQAPEGMFRISFQDVVNNLGATAREVSRG